MEWLWIVLALVAAVAQLGRNIGQRALVSGQGALSRDVANAARYWVGLPLAVLIFLALIWVLDVWPHFGARTLIFAAIAGVAQILATDLLIRLFQRRAFGIGVAYQKTENLMMALVGPLGVAALLGLSVGDDVLSFWDWAGLVLAMVGVIVQSFLKLDKQARAFDGISLMIGLLCGLAFTVTGIALAEAVRTVGLDRTTTGGAVLAGTTVLVLTLTIQSLVMLAWIGSTQVSELRKIPRRLGGVLQIGAFSVIASLALFSAFGLAHPALVSTVKQVDMPLSLLVAYLLYREVPQRWEWLGMALIFVSVLLIVVL